jgi:hypothetical protein
LTAGITLLGRHSLLVYTAHVFTEVPVLEYAWGVWPPAMVRVALAVADLAALALLCVAVENRLHVRLATWARAFTARLTAAGFRRGRILIPLTAAALLLILLRTHSTSRDKRGAIEPVIAPAGHADQEPAVVQDVSPIDGATFLVPPPETSDGEDAAFGAAEDGQQSAPALDEIGGREPAPV